MNKWMLLVALTACSSSKSDKPKAQLSVQAESALDFAREQLPALDKALASSDPGAGSSICAMLKADSKYLREADPALAETAEKRCGHDLAIRSLTVGAERAEAARKAQPTGHIFECSSRNSYEKMITAAGAEGDPALPAVRERWAAACPAR